MTGSIPASGSRAQVWHGNAVHTSGGLRKSDLFMHNGRIKSKSMSSASKRNHNLGGYLLKKGSHAFVLGGAM